ncbi:effector-associated constant component EACC1 [Streptomyces milbemycinicus]|uniref:effector-associated constant component EACC1 n=1 Tax=Streptomyces milbemycinicus TaxID=476552 RepID=UPI0033D20563
MTDMTQSCCGPEQAVGGGQRMLEVHFTALSDYFAPDDDRWLQQIRLLHEALEEQTPGALTSRSGTPSETPSGTKGAATDLVLLLATPSVVAGAVKVFTSWLNRDRGRTVHVTWNNDGRRGEFTVSGDVVDAATVQAALEHGLRAAGGSAQDSDSSTSDDSAPGPRSDG